MYSSALQVNSSWAIQDIPLAESDKEFAEFAKLAGVCSYIGSYIGREEIEFYPQALLLFEYLGPNPRTVWVRNVQIQTQIQKSTYRIARRSKSPFLKPPTISFS